MASPNDRAKPFTRLIDKLVESLADGEYLVLRADILDANGTLLRRGKFSELENEGGSL